MTERRKLLGNSFSLLVNRLTQSITTFVLVASIARMLGSYELGQYMLASSYYFVFMTLVSQGFKTLFTRELAKKPEETPIYLVNGTLLQLIFSILGYWVLFGVVFALPYSEETSKVCYILGLAIIPFSLSNITEAIFQSQEKMHLITASAVPVYILRLLAMIWVMSLKHNISVISTIFVISEIVVLIIQWYLITRIVKCKWLIDWDFLWRTTKASKTFLFIEGISVFGSRVQVLILSLLGGEVLVGLYSAITQLSQPFEILSNSLVLAFFPKMSKAIALGKEKQRYLAENLIEILLIVAFPFMIGIKFIGADLLVLVYKESNFAQAATALNIIAIGLVATAFIRPLSYILVANGFERINLFDVFISTLVGGVLSILLVPQYQLNGAAYSGTITQIISLAVYVFGVYSRLFYLNLWNIIRRPLLVSTLMLATFLFLQQYNLNLLVTILVATLIYALIVGILGVYALGGFGVVSAKLLARK
jgi:O-antigen/teichoic acid export membrane protein